MSVRRRWLVGLLVLVALPAVLGVGLTAMLWDSQRDSPISLQSAALTGEGLILCDIVGRWGSYRVRADIGVPPELHAARSIHVTDVAAEQPASIIPVSVLKESWGSGDPIRPEGLSAFLDLEGYGSVESLKVTWLDEAGERWDVVPFELPIVWRWPGSCIALAATPFTVLIDGLTFPFHAVGRLLPGTSGETLFSWFRS